MVGDHTSHTRWFAIAVHDGPNIKGIPTANLPHCPPRLLPVSTTISSLTAPGASVSRLFVLGCCMLVTSRSRLRLISPASQMCDAPGLPHPASSASNSRVAGKGLQRLTAGPMGVRRQTGSAPLSCAPLQTPPPPLAHARRPCISRWRRSSSRPRHRHSGERLSVVHLARPGKAHNLFGC